MTGKEAAKRRVTFVSLSPRETYHVRLKQMITLALSFLMVLTCLDLTAPVSLSAALTARQLVESVPETTNIIGAEDLIDEVISIGQMIAEDGQHYTPGVNLHNGTQAHFLYAYGRSLFAVAQILPFLPGDAADPSTLRGQVVAYLKSELQTYMLSDSYYNVEEGGSIGYRLSASNYRGWGPAVLRPGEEALDGNPSQEGLSGTWRWFTDGFQGAAGLSWGLGFLPPLESSRWEGLLALWSYAHYSGDWAFISSSWSTIKNIRAQAVSNPVKPGELDQNPNATAANAWMMGLVAYARRARRVGDTTAESEALSSLSGAMNIRSNQGVGGNKQFSYNSRLTLWRIDRWDDWTLDFGRRLREQFGQSAISNQINSLVTDNRIFLWQESDMSHAHGGETQQQASWISFPIYQAYTAALADVGSNGEWTYSAANRTFLREYLPQPVISRVTPYHREAFLLQNLVALIRAHGTTYWVAP